MKTVKKILASLLTFILVSTTSVCFADSDTKKVFIDPGHGGSDSGAISYDAKFTEKELNLDTSKAVIKELEKYGVKTYAARTDDTTVGLRERSEMANKIKDLDLFVSIHHNASTNKRANRSEVIYQFNSRDSQLLAECISNKLQGIGEDIEVKIYSRYNSKGTDYYSVLRNTNAPAVIVEISFITSEEGLALVDSPAERERNGILIAHGILDYFQIEYDELSENEINVKENKETKKETTVEKNNEPQSALDILMNACKNTNKNKSGVDIINKILGRK